MNLGVLGQRSNQLGYAGGAKILFLGAKIFFFFRDHIISTALQLAFHILYLGYLYKLVTVYLAHFVQ